MNACPTRELLERYASGDCSGAESLALAEHLTKCDDCRTQFDQTRAIADIPGQLDSPYSTDADRDETQLIDADELPTVQIDDQPTVVSTDQPDFTKSIESMIEGYKIVETLPRGGQAAVYKAEHRATKTNVAIKVLLPTLLASDRARYYFEREAELIATLDHPNIVSIRDSGIIHHQYYFVMQFIDGQPLRRYVQAEKLSFREKVELVSKICSAITYAHQQGIIHRDLKFANILVDKRGEPHILDFGLAKAIGIDEQADDKAVATMTGQWAGSLSTMSPEQASGQPNLIDVRTDVYSLGVILYTLLTGQYPYDVAGTTLEALKNIQETDPARPRQIVPKFNSEMEAILLTALEKEREKRYQSTAELQSDIENWLEGRPIRVKSISTIYLLKKIIGRHRYTSTVAALLAIIVLAFGFISFELFKRSERTREELEERSRETIALAAKVPTLARRFRFGEFIQSWRAEDNRHAAFLAAILTPQTKEETAAAFLLDPKPIEAKLPDFEDALAKDNSGFAGFVIAEHYLRDGKREEALAAYRNTYDTMKQLRKCGVPVDSWLDTYTRARLFELKSEKKPADDTIPVEPGGPKE